MDMGLKDKVVLITGGSRGIGAELAQLYARESALVAITYASDPAKGNGTVEAVEAAGAQALAVRLDLSDLESISAAVDTVVRRWGRIDVLVANAYAYPNQGSDTEQLFSQTPAAEWQPLLRDNLEGTLATLQAVLPAMSESQDARIVLVSSDIADRGMAGAGFYGAGKAALAGAMRSLIAELEGRALVNIVLPGLTLTPEMNEVIPPQERDKLAQETPSRKLSSVADVANTILFLGSPANGNITGASIAVNGGL